MVSYKMNSTLLSDVEEDQRSRETADKWIFGLLLVVIGLVPLLVGGYVKDIASPLITNIGDIASGTKGDIFTHYKMIVILIITMIITGIFLTKIIFMNGQLRKTKLNIFIPIFGIAIVMSTILSPSISIALWGQYNRSDGAISYICYLALFFIAMNIDYPKKAVHYVMYSLYPFILINLILITMNFTGHDAMTYPAVQKLMTIFLPEGASLGGNSIMLGTLNQWNFMSGMFAVMTVMYLAWSIVDASKIRSFINAGVAVISFAIMLMSISTSGFLTIVVLTPLLIVLILKSSQPAKALIAVLAFLIISVPVFHVLAEKDPRVWNESIGFIVKKNPYIKEQPAAMEHSEIQFPWVKKTYAAENQFELPVLPERGIAAGSGRMYIWEKTVELTMNRPLFGYGLDTLMYHFPHYHIDARAGMWDENTIVDKPHSMYVGIFYGTGIVGFLGFAGIVLLTVIAAVKIIVNRRQTIIAVLAVGWLAFLFQGLFNDSLPGTAGPMWAIAGIMLGMLYANKDVEEITDGRND
ncbi:O-antigen ligase family protein [Sporosarcina sp. Sa2YVA2]|uniref:O-antigen ligase family protein n=1 Tax=Sporosarcina quadrami TaxID=2762234 RepID=A0ABR8U973_9BACL|nr:O-antigen ligase family protein [Sporosarcina quadrami]MBD7984592.1 O-antigen ligase family protein [Sporosarcina quadrami]